jgi:hypothetical protein
MLTFHINDAGNFVVTQRLMNFSDTKTMTVEYSQDLMHKRVNQEPWHDISDNDRAWFEKHYRKKFVEFARRMANPKQVERLRAGFFEAKDEAYKQWCEDNPDALQEDRKAAYAEIYERLRAKYVIIEKIYPVCVN